jgi:cation:H+ antiporter
MLASASSLAVSFGVSGWVVGVTIVAAGTSFPEFATTLAGVVRRQYGLSVGNIIGSDLFNILGVLGLAGILPGMHVDPAARVSLGALSLVALTAVFFMRSEWRLSRREGLFLVAFALLRWGFNLSG